MERLKNEKFVKITSLVLAASFLISIVALYATMGMNSAGAASDSHIGYVDTQMLFKDSPATLEARNKLAEEAQKAEEEFNKKSANLDAAAQEKLYGEYQEKLSKREQELVQGVLDKIDGTVGEVAKAKGLTIVLDKSNVLYGGVDVTSDVASKLNK